MPKSLFSAATNTAQLTDPTLNQTQHTAWFIQACSNRSRTEVLQTTMGQPHGEVRRGKKSLSDGN